MGIKASHSKEFTIEENFKEIFKKKTYNDIKFIIQCLKNHFVFYNLKDNQM